MHWNIGHDPVVNKVELCFLADPAYDQCEADLLGVLYVLRHVAIINKVARSASGMVNETRFAIEGDVDADVVIVLLGKVRQDQIDCKIGISDVVETHGGTSWWRTK